MGTVIGNDGERVIAAVPACGNDCHAIRRVEDSLVPVACSRGKGYRHIAAGLCTCKDDAIPQVVIFGQEELLILFSPQILTWRSRNPDDRN